MYKTSEVDLHSVIKLDYFWIDINGEGHCECDQCKKE